MAHLLPLTISVGNAVRANLCAARREVCYQPHRVCTHRVRWQLPCEACEHSRVHHSACSDSLTASPPPTACGTSRCAEAVTRRVHTLCTSKLAIEALRLPHNPCPVAHT